MKKPYYDLAFALYMAKNHDLRFYFGRWIRGDYLVIIYWLQNDINCGDINILTDTKFYVANPEILEPQEGDVDCCGRIYARNIGGWDSEGKPVSYAIGWAGMGRDTVQHSQTAFRNGKHFLTPSYE
jgi:hypothetical protein